jgi:hypothetical protein
MDVIYLGLLMVLFLLTLGLVSAMHRMVGRS